MVLKEAVDYTEEESEARKTEMENVSICYRIIALLKITELSKGVAKNCAKLYNFQLPFVSSTKVISQFAHLYFLFRNILLVLSKIQPGSEESEVSEPQ